jgi:hypothetical protein
MSIDIEGHSEGVLIEFQYDKLKTASRNFHGITMTGICKSCNHSHIFKTNRTNDPTVLCGFGEKSFQVSLDISECNKFSQIGTLSVWELAKLATPVDLDKRTLGFGVEESK